MGVTAAAGPGTIVRGNAARGAAGQNERRERYVADTVNADTLNADRINDDVDRAAAAFGGGPFHYRTFSPVRIGPAMVGERLAGAMTIPARQAGDVGGRAGVEQFADGMAAEGTVKIGSARIWPANRTGLMARAAAPRAVDPVPPAESSPGATSFPSPEAAPATAVSEPVAAPPPAIVSNLLLAPPELPPAPLAETVESERAEPELAAPAPPEPPPAEAEVCEPGPAEPELAEPELAEPEFAGPELATPQAALPETAVEAAAFPASPDPVERAPSLDSPTLDDPMLDEPALHQPETAETSAAKVSPPQLIGPGFPTLVDTLPNIPLSEFVEPPLAQTALALSPGFSLADRVIAAASALPAAPAVAFAPALQPAGQPVDRPAFTMALLFAEPGVFAAPPMRAWPQSPPPLRRPPERPASPSRADQQALQMNWGNADGADSPATDVPAFEPIAVQAVAAPVPPPAAALDESALFRRL